jgi:threonine dehydrogenase-like Zn-dependent dehydrogenase
MKALTFHGPQTIRYESVADPSIIDDGDVIVKVACCAICGSDLHVYHGRETGCDHGTAMGHEFTGTIVETGSNVTSLKTGQRVMSPFTTSCGECIYCRRGLTSRCVHSQLFGWVQDNVGLQGTQAEYVRVPLADNTLMPVPDSLSPEQALLLGDVIPTGYYCAQQADIHPEGTYVVIGCGAVGLMAVIGAKALGATEIYAIDVLDDRLALAAQFGARVINAAQQDQLTRLRMDGVDGVLEAVGSNAALVLGYSLVKPGGTISVVGVNTAQALPFAANDLYNKNISLKVGRCPARHLMERLLPVVASGKYDFTSIISHRLPLADGPSAYDLFAERKDHCTKVILAP